MSDHKGYPTPQEIVILRIHDETHLSVFEIASKLFIDPQTVMRVLKYWRDEDATKPKEEEGNKTMAKKDKNKEEREANMKKLRNGIMVYSLDPDKLRGLVGELQENECFIVLKQSSTNNVNLRLGDYAYSR
jgi:predicted transcriptional regulator